MKDNFIKNSISKNFMLKLFSVIFALLLWSYVINEVDPERTDMERNINVRIENIASLRENNLALISPTEVTTNVIVKGKNSAMRNLRREAIIARVDLSGYNAGEHTVPIVINTLDPGISVDRFDPKSVVFKIDENIKKKMTVEIVTEGNLKEDFILGKIKKSFDVEVSGAKTFVENIEKLTALVNITNRDESTVLPVKVVAYDKNGEELNNIKINPNTIDVEVPVLMTKTVPVKLKTYGFSNKVSENGVTIEPNAVSIKGNTAVLNKISEISTKPISLSDIEDGIADVKLNLPEGVSLVEHEAKFVVKFSLINNVLN